MIIFDQITSIMAKKDFEIRHGILEGRKDVEYFNLTCIPDNISERTNNCCNYEQIMKMINEIRPDCITIYPEDLNAVTLIRFCMIHMQIIHQTQEKYREVENL